MCYQTTPACCVVGGDWLFLYDVTSVFEEHILMKENMSQTLENAHSEFKSRNFKDAEELYTQFVASCLQSRYHCPFRDGKPANQVSCC